MTETDRVKLGATVALSALLMGLVGAILIGTLALLGIVLIAFAILGVVQGLAIALGIINLSGSEKTTDRDEDDR